jgi:hypothetical protein
MRWFLREGIICKRKCLAAYICCSVHWGYAFTFGFISCRLRGQETEKELEDFIYERYRMYVNINARKEAVFTRLVEKTEWSED